MWSFSSSCLSKVLRSLKTSICSDCLRCSVGILISGHLSKVWERLVLSNSNIRLGKECGYMGLGPSGVLRKGFGWLGLRKNVGRLGNRHSRLGLRKHCVVFGKERGSLCLLETDRLWRGRQQ
ncbi:hypothetical protein TYRP_017673 [Tyrophagus putrescentiae]|nr:hypothetical protein TYRP_017673 [Tyrophagus putrescentiae]